jgi:LysR family transcriptional regulator, glycine cleavage system transcriptional activator
MYSRAPSIQTMRAVIATVKHASVAAAARELCVTSGAVSRALRDIEERLGFPLFVRAKQRVVPTPAARELASAFEAALSEVDSAVDRAIADRLGARSIVLSCEPTLLIRWLIPRLERLQAWLGDSELRLVSAGGPVEFIRDGIDLAIRRADFPVGQGLRIRPFLAERVGPVLRDGRAAQRWPRETISDVLLHAATRPAAWEDWAARTGVALSPIRSVRLEHFYQTLHAAVAGTGVAIGPVALVADDLAAGSLFAPFGFVPDGSEYVLMMSEESGHNEIFNRLFEWLVFEVEPLQSL